MEKKELNKLYPGKWLVFFRGDVDSIIHQLVEEQKELIPIKGIDVSLPYPTFVNPVVQFLIHLEFFLKDLGSLGKFHLPVYKEENLEEKFERLLSAMVLGWQSNIESRKEYMDPDTYCSELLRSYHSLLCLDELAQVLTEIGKILLLRKPFSKEDNGNPIFVWPIYNVLGLKKSWFDEKLVPWINVFLQLPVKLVLFCSDREKWEELKSNHKIYSLFMQEKIENPLENKRIKEPSEPSC